MSDRRLFALSDPHLSAVAAKPMEVFGPHWRDHVGRIAANWNATVGNDDIVLVPGDISWAMRLEDAAPDLEWLAALPGRKVMIKGNHDYWWQSAGKVRRLGIPGLYFIQNDHVVLDGVAIGGTRLWDFPGLGWSFTPGPENIPGVSTGKGQRHEDPDKIRARELGRLEASLAGLPADAGLRIAMTHYPPIGEDGHPTIVTDLIGRFDIDICVFGHVHAPRDEARPGEDILIDGTRYVLASSDHLKHTPLMLAEF